MLSSLDLCRFNLAEKISFISKRQRETQKCGLTFEKILGAFECSNGKKLW